MSEPPTPSPRAAILRQATSIGVAVIPFGIAFGVAARQADIHVLEALGFSALVFSGSAQFAAVSVLADGGTVAAAVASGTGRRGGVMSPATTTLVILAIGTYALKAAGPLVLGGDRKLPPLVERLTLLLPAPLLAALVATSTFVDDQRWLLDARVVGLAVAAIALWRRLPFVVVVVLAAAATAATRAIA